MSLASDYRDERGTMTSLSWNAVDRPSLLVSVRSADEALAAVVGGAAIVDVKEPDRGPLGMADFAAWSAVRSVVPRGVPVSVALGELGEWIDRPTPPDSAFAGIAFRKIGLAGAGGRWAEDWADLRIRLGGETPWIAVIYADWIAARAPEPDAVIAEARRAGCAGVLIDTWDKSEAPIDLSWAGIVERIKAEVGLVALAGGLDRERIARLRGLDPDLFAVRGAACRGGDRQAAIDAGRVADLAAVCRAL
jgi:(5-formylfuran-3-yl)methyl phosphate synthase